jgi:hypothetical protein
MSSKDLWFARFKWLGGLVLLVTIVSVLLSLDRGSLERANRLYRDGETQAAAELYRVHADAPDHTAAATYNLGTALLALDDDEAEHYLRLAAQDVDSVARQRAHYNLGYRSLTRVSQITDPDSALPVATAAVRSNRAALLLNPGDENAQWNFALAQRMVDSLTSLPGDRQSEPPPEQEEEIPVGADPDAQMTDQLGEEQKGAVAVAGAREALANKAGDPGPLTEAEALAYLDNVTDDVEELILGLLWSQRPVHSGWRSSPPPGGKW